MSEWDGGVRKDGYDDWGTVLQISGWPVRQNEESLTCLRRQESECVPEPSTRDNTESVGDNDVDQLARMISETIYRYRLYVV